MCVSMLCRVDSPKMAISLFKVPVTVTYSFCSSRAVAPVLSSVVALQACVHNIIYCVLYSLVAVSVSVCVSIFHAVWGEAKAAVVVVVWKVQDSCDAGDDCCDCDCDCDC